MKQLQLSRLDSLPLLDILCEIVQFAFPFTLQLNYPSLQLQIHLSLCVLNMTFQSQQFLLDPRLPTNPHTFIFFSTPFYHRQYFLLQLLYFFQSTLLSFSLLFLSTAENRSHSTVFFSIRIVVRLSVVVIIVGWSFL